MRRYHFVPPQIPEIHSVVLFFVLFFCHQMRKRSANCTPFIYPAYEPVPFVTIASNASHHKLCHEVRNQTYFRYPPDDEHSIYLYNFVFSLQSRVDANIKNVEVSFGDDRKIKLALKVDNDCSELVLGVEFLKTNMVRTSFPNARYKATQQV
jgi:hypothetical protein